MLSSDGGPAQVFAKWNPYTRLQKQGPGMGEAKRSFFSWVGRSFLHTNQRLRSFRSSIGFSDDNVLASRWWRFSSVLDPRSNFVRRWQYIFIAACLFGIFIDPLFFYLPISLKDKDGSILMCVKIQKSLAVMVTVLRTLTDMLYLVHMYMQFRVAFIAPMTRTFGRGELVTNPVLIRRRYLKGAFWLDILAVLPLPQIFLWGVIPKLGPSVATNSKNVLRYLVFVQYIPRLFRVWPLLLRMQKNAGIIMTTAWAGAFVNLLLYLLVSHLFGAVFYLLAVERSDSCWRERCRRAGPDCHVRYLDCGTIGEPERIKWFNSTTGYEMADACTIKDDLGTGGFDFGIYEMAVKKIVWDQNFVHRYFWCLWWGLQTLSSIGQNLMPSTYIPEDVFCILIAIVGLMLFALLIGNIQAYLSSLTLRLEEMRLKRRDTEKWMHHRHVPSELRRRVRAYDQFRWVVTRGVDEESLIREWPADLRRDIKRYMCLDLVRKVPLFEDMDERLLDAICERLQPTLFTEDSIPLRESDPVRCMFFIYRGHLQSVTTNGGRTGFFEMGNLGPGQFFGEELLTWALDPLPREILPLSTRTIETKTEVEAFALMAEDLKFVASQYRRLHSRQLQHVFRFHSQQWRTWAACSIQAAWRRYRKRKMRKLAALEEAMDDAEESPDYNPANIAADDGERTLSIGAAANISRFAKNIMNPITAKRRKAANTESPPSPPRRPPVIPKPHEPDFSHLASMEEELPPPPRVAYSGMLSGHSGFLGAPVPPIRTAARNTGGSAPSGPLDHYGQSIAWVPRSGYLGGPSRHSGYLGPPTGDIYQPYDPSRVGFTGPL